jgi:hypothetical protein
MTDKTLADAPAREETLAESQTPDAPGKESVPQETPVEIEELGGPKGPEPTRFGDWERGGRCSDF